MECPNCKKELADNAKSCPNCGYDFMEQQNQKNAVQGVGCLFFTIFFIILVVGGFLYWLFS